MHLTWNGDVKEPWALALEGAQVVVQLPLPQMSTDHRPGMLAENQQQHTRSIAQGIRSCKLAPHVWLQVSSTLWYRDSPSEAATEWLGEPGIEPDNRAVQHAEEDFFAELVPAFTRKLALRSAMVLCQSQQRQLAAVAATDRIKSDSCGWIHPCDWLNAIHFLIENPLLDGLFNLCAPTELPLSMLYEWAGSSDANSTMLRDFHLAPFAEPARLIDEGFVFSHNTLTSALRALTPKVANPVSRRLVGAHC